MLQAIQQTTTKAGRVYHTHPEATGRTMRTLCVQLPRGLYPVERDGEVVGYFLCDGASYMPVYKDFTYDVYRDGKVHHRFPLEALYEHEASEGRPLFPQGTLPGIPVRG